MTTPKRNEAVAVTPYLWITQEDQRRISRDEDCVIACPHISSAPSDAVYLYHADALSALQGEVSRLREVVAEGLAFLTSKQWGMIGYMDDGVYDDASDLAKKFRTNLEPPTDGR